MHTLQYLEILYDLYSNEIANYKLQVLAFFKPSKDLITEITINPNGALILGSYGELSCDVLDDFQEEFAVKLKDTREVNLYKGGDVAVNHMYFFQKVNYYSDHKTFWESNNYLDLSSQLKKVIDIYI